MRTTVSVPRTYTPRKLWSGLGLRLDSSAVPPGHDTDAYCTTPAALVYEALSSLGGKAPTHAVLTTLAQLGAFWPEDLLLDAVTDTAGGFSWYRVKKRA